MPVLVVAAIYETLAPHIQERILPLESHNAADSQTQALGDVQIVVLDANEAVITCYEMKTRRVTINDIDVVIQEKLAHTHHPIDNYIFITTETIEPQVSAYARSRYELTGIELVVLDCISFLRHFLHLFHRQRTEFLDIYQRILLAEPDSAVSQSLKEVFLALRHAAQSE